MSTAIYTVRSLAELRAIKQPHPLRSVSNGDYVHLIGDVNRDDCAFFQAQVTDSPTESLPESLSSDDGKIQWDKVSHGFFDGAVPNSLETTGKFGGSIPSGWSSASVPPLAYTITYLQEFAYYSGLSCEHVSGKVWVTSENIIEIDLNNLTSAVHLVGTMTDSTSSLGEHGRCYSKSEDKIHIIDTAGNHHLFDVATTTMSYAAKAAYPVAMNQNFMIDASQENNKLYYINRYSSLAYDIYEYDITGDTWTHKGVCPAQPCSWAPDPHNPGKFLVCLYGNGVYTLDSSDGSFTLKHSITAFNTITRPYNHPSALFWDPISGRLYSPYNEDYVYYDPLTGDTGLLTDMNILYRAVGYSMSVYLGEGVNFFLDDEEIDGYKLISVSPYSVYKKERP